LCDPCPEKLMKIIFEKLKSCKKQQMEEKSGKREK
jgi:hypothetical protein